MRRRGEFFPDTLITQLPVVQWKLLIKLLNKHELVGNEEIMRVINLSLVSSDESRIVGLLEGISIVGSMYQSKITKMKACEYDRLIDNFRVMSAEIDQRKDSLKLSASILASNVTKLSKLSTQYGDFIKILEEKPVHIPVTCPKAPLSTPSSSSTSLIERKPIQFYKYGDFVFSYTGLNQINPNSVNGRFRSTSSSWTRFGRELAFCSAKALPHFLSREPYKTFKIWEEAGRVGLHTAEGRTQLMEALIKGRVPKGDDFVSPRG